MGNRWRRWRYKGSDLPDDEMAHHETAAHITARSHSEPAVNSDATCAAAGNSHSSNSNGHAHTSGSSSSGKLPWRVRVEKKLQVTRQLQKQHRGVLHPLKIAGILTVCALYFHNAYCYRLHLDTTATTATAAAITATAAIDASASITASAATSRGIAATTAITVDRRASLCSAAAIKTNAVTSTASDMFRCAQ
eukprot:19529-Heterococcus_DN1.PRE.3